MSPRAVLALGLLLLVPQWARAASPLERVAVREQHSPAYGRGLELTFKPLGPDPALARFTVENAMGPPVRFFELWDEMSVPGRWVLYQTDIDEHGRKVDPWMFDKGVALHLEGKPILGISHPGIPLDFSLTELATPVVTGRFVSLFEQLELGNEIQFIPAQVEGQTEPFFILNVLHVIRCIDDARCEHVSYWTPEDGEPELVGKYENVRGLKVDPARMGDVSICRPWGWTGAIILTERIKLAMERAGLTGLRLREA